MGRFATLERRGDGCPGVPPCPPGRFRGIDEIGSARPPDPGGHPLSPASVSHRLRLGTWSGLPPFRAPFANVARDADELRQRAKGALKAFAISAEASTTSACHPPLEMEKPGWASQERRTIRIREQSKAPSSGNRKPTRPSLPVDPGAAKAGLLDGPLDALLIAHYLRLGGEGVCGHKGGRRPPTIRGLGSDNQLADWWGGLTVDHKDDLTKAWKVM